MKRQTMAKRLRTKLREVKAKVSTGQTFLKYSAGLVPARVSSPAWTPNMMAMASGCHMASPPA